MFLYLYIQYIYDRSMHTYIHTYLVNPLLGDAVKSTPVYIYINVHINTWGKHTYVNTYEDDMV